MQKPKVQEWPGQLSHYVIIQLTLIPTQVFPTNKSLACKTVGDKKQSATADVEHHRNRIILEECSKHLPTLLLVGKAAWGCQKSKRPQEHCQRFNVCCVQARVAQAMYKNWFPITL
jgi:hypothetical protein